MAEQDNSSARIVLRELSAGDLPAISEITKTVYDGEDYWLQCFNNWKMSDASRDGNGDGEKKVGSSFAFGVQTSDGLLVGLNVVQWVSEDSVWVMGLRVSPDARGKGAGSRAFEVRMYTSAFWNQSSVLTLRYLQIALEWARVRGAISFAMSTVSVNKASLAIGNKFGLVIRSEFDQIAVKRRFTCRQTVTEPKETALDARTPSKMISTLSLLVRADVPDERPDDKLVISTSWAYTPLSSEAIQAFLDPCCTCFVHSGRAEESLEAVLIEQRYCSTYIRDGPKPGEPNTLDLWWTICGTNIAVASELLRARTVQIEREHPNKKVVLWLFSPERLLSAPKQLGWNVTRSTYLLHYLSKTEWPIQ